MRGTIPVRWNADLGEWETFSWSQGWTCTENLLRHFTQEDVKAYYAQFGRLVRFYQTFEMEQA